MCRCAAYGPPPIKNGKTAKTQSGFGRAIFGSFARLGREIHELLEAKELANKNCLLKKTPSRENESSDDVGEGENDSEQGGEPEVAS